MIQAADLFCGAGGTSTGMIQAAESLGMKLNLLAINHWNVAISTHELNHPNVRHQCESLDAIRPSEVVPDGKLHLLAASPECTHHSLAAGGRPKNDQSRSTAWQVCRWASDLRVDNIFIENVREFRNWGPLNAAGKPISSRKGETFRAFIQSLESMGYRVEHKIQNAAEFGDPTSRQRLIILARSHGRKIVWPEASHGTVDLLRPDVIPFRTARQIIDWTIRGKSIFTRTKQLSPNTIRRIKAGLEKFGGKNATPFILNLSHGSSDGIRSVDCPLATITTARGGEFALAEPFLVKYYGAETTGQSVDKPIGTITTRDRFLLIEPTIQMDILFRMLQPHELSAAMGFPSGYKFSGTKTEQVKQIGNAVPVNLARAHCRELLKNNTK